MIPKLDLVENRDRVAGDKDTVGLMSGRSNGQSWILVANSEVSKLIREILSSKEVIEVIKGGMSRWPLSHLKMHMKGRVTVRPAYAPLSLRPVSRNPSSALEQPDNRAAQPSLRQLEDSVGRHKNRRDGCLVVSDPIGDGQ